MTPWGNSSNEYSDESDSDTEAGGLLHNALDTALSKHLQASPVKM